MPVSSHYECGECGHRFRVPEGMTRDTRLLMCPACGSIDLNVMRTDQTPSAIWSSRPEAPAPSWAARRDKKAS